jgi:hypothetical protein
LIVRKMERATGIEPALEHRRAKAALRKLRRAGSDRSSRI